MSDTQKLTKSQKLLRDAREAAELRAYRTHPDVAALSIERIRTAVGALVWTGLVLGLLFTMANVQQFAARGAEAWSLGWLIAWVLDPMVSLCLVGVLIAESTLARYRLKAGPWVRAAKWGLLGATFAMNTWQSLWNWPPTPALFLLHAVPPLVVWVMAEAITDLRSKLTDAVIAAHRFATQAMRDTTEAPWPTVDTDTAITRPVEAAERTATLPEPTDGKTTEGQSAPSTPDRPSRSKPGKDHAARVADRTATGTGSKPGPDVSDLLGPGGQVRDRLAAQGQSVTRRALITGLREAGHAVSTDRASALLKALTAEPAVTEARRSTDPVSGAHDASEAA